ncbi:hypothetical protein BJ742DRAFT_740615 [Cladochytrium replicatum]|nr:hypothetical protein BJ742DRAFT_740615 [Cladochytrium replicatum]
MPQPIFFLVAFVGVFPMVSSQNSAASSPAPTNGSDPNLGRDKVLVFVIPVVIAIVGVALMCWWFGRQRRKSAVLQMDIDDESKRFDTAARRGLHMEHKLREREEAEAAAKAAFSLQRKQQQQQRATQMRVIPLGVPQLLRPQTLPPGSLSLQTLPPGSQTLPPGSIPPQPLPPGSLPPAHRSASPPPGAILVGPTIRTPIGQPLLQHSHTYPPPSMLQQHQPVFSPLVHPPPLTFSHPQYVSPQRLQTQPLLMRASTSPSVRTTPTIAPGWIQSAMPEYASPQPMTLSTPVPHPHPHQPPHPGQQYFQQHMSPAPSPPVLIPGGPHPPPMPLQNTAPPQPMVMQHTIPPHEHQNPSPPLLSPPLLLQQQQPRPQSTRSPPIITKEDMMLVPHARSLHEQTPVSPPILSPAQQIHSPLSQHHVLQSPPIPSIGATSQPRSPEQLGGAISPPILSPVSQERKDAELPAIPALAQ